MAETIAVSPSLPSLHTSPAFRTSTESTAQYRNSSLKEPPKASEKNGITKKKQSKSRNGCVTCKLKRLKCDETKPTCEQCKRRCVSCEGYKKNFKWRPFEDPGCVGKQPNKTKTGSSSSNKELASVYGSQSTNFYSSCLDYSDPANTPNLTPAHSITTDPYHQLYAPSSLCNSYEMAESIYDVQMLHSFAFTPQSISPVDSFAPTFETSQGMYNDGTMDMGDIHATASSSVTAGQSPRLVDLLLPGPGHCAPLEEYLSYRYQHEAFYDSAHPKNSAQSEEEDVEHVPQNLSLSLGPWSLRHSSPTPSGSSDSSTKSRDYRILAQPQYALDSPEIISRRFHRDTCGVLSVKDGPTENPWRTLVWPLARDCPALYHAIASMTSFHQSSQFPPMRIQGIDHMHTAVQALSEGLQNMRFDAAISTTLVLAFAESWDVHISTGINHIKGAKVLINQALTQHRQTPKQGAEWTRLKFLCSTWIYMDVIARLTSADEGDSNDVDSIHKAIYSTGQMETSLDPLMGCAHSLFPIIGRVATLVRNLRRISRCSPDLLSQATHLMSQLENWKPPSHIENPEDETTSPGDSIRTATAYQYATLLYLHQAVPEIPSLSAYILAKRALCELAAVEPSSRSCIIHIFPLMAAGCEMVDTKDRAWVTQRWELLSSRMKLGIIEKSLTVTKEVWARRDAYAAECNILKASRNDSISPIESSKRSLDTYLDSNGDDVCWLGSRPKRRAVASVSRHPMTIPSISEQESVSCDDSGLFDPEFTVKGRLHWLGVMQDWNWEVLLG